MGCWDIFCFLCGNTCHSSTYMVQDLLKDIDMYEKNKGNKYFKKYFKPIYEQYKKNPTKIINKLDEVIKNTKWLNKCTFLCADNKIVHGCSEIYCNIVFKDKNNKKYINQTYSDEYVDSYGVFLHTDCWNFIKKQYNVDLKYAHLPITVFDMTQPQIFNFIDYGIIDKYWEQEFNFLKLIIDNNEKLCFSPLVSNIVAKNIKKVFSKLQIRNDIKRKSPPVSATFYDENTYKVGNNGNIWTVKNNKWIELKNTIIKTVKDVKNNVYIGDVNQKPLFVINKNKNEYKILTV